MKTLILIALLVRTFIANADEIQTLTSSNEVYRATIKPNVVFYTIVGKSSPMRTNITGWLSLKTNLLLQGYSFKVDTTVTNKVTPLIVNKTDDLTARSKQVRQAYDKKVAADRAAQAEARRKSMEQRALSDPNLREAAENAYQQKLADERVEQGLKVMKEGRKVEIP